MEPLNNPGPKTNRTALIISTVAAILLTGVLLVFVFGDKSPEVATTKIVASPQANLTAGTVAEDATAPADALEQKLLQLKKISADYTVLAASGGNKTMLDSLQKQLINGEVNLQAAIDSVWIDAVAGRKNGTASADNLNAYRKSLDSIKSLNKGSDADLANKDYIPDREAFIKLQNELMEKTNRIALLESSIEVMAKQAQADDSRTGVIKTVEPQPATVAVLESKIAELTNGNQRLVQEVDRLKKQPVDAGKNNSAEQLLLSKNTALQQKVNAINAELQLVRVDCNLSRVDATQIISNSKQRKLLLSEASSILTDLSANGDADIRSKVKEKIVRLNQVAANTRD